MIMSTTSTAQADPLDGFSRIQREVISWQLMKTPMSEFHKVPRRQWACYRGCGLKMQELLKQRGWIYDEPDCGLSSRAKGVLEFLLVDTTKEAVAAALDSGVLFWKSSTSHSGRNLGLTTFNELLRFVGRPEITESARAWKFDPYTGKRITKRK